MKVDEDGNLTEKVELEIDGLLFNKHPYVDKDFGRYISSHLASLPNLSEIVNLLCLNLQC